ncbi:MAG TPA: ABC transporter substrate-binding protein [Chloroflexota bacterium]
MSAIFRSRALSAAMVATLLALTTTTAGGAASTRNRSPAPSNETTLPTLHLAGGPPRSLDNVWLGFNELFLEVNAGLTHILPNGKVAPDLATWTLSKNRLIYTFSIRRNARFSNGHAVTAQDADFSLKRFLTPSLGPDGLTYFGLIRGAAAYNAGKTRILSGVKALNRRTLQITITRPAVYFPMELANYSAVFDPAVVAGKPLGNPNDQFQTGYLSTTCTANQGAGPFRFVCRDNSSTLHSFYSGDIPTYRLEPNPYFYGRKPHIMLEYRTYPDIARAYLAGTVDASAHLPTLVEGRLRTSNQYHEFPSSAIDFLTPNVHLAPFNDVSCRLAVAYALNRSALVSQVLDSVRHPTYAIVPPGMLGYYAGSDNPHYNLSRARAELAQCPSRTSPVALTYPDMGASSRTVGQSIVRMLADAGFTASLKLIPGSEWHTVVTHPLDQSHTQIIPNGWAQDYSDPQDYSTLLLRSGQRFNVGGWQDATYDRLVDRADRLVSPQKRAQLYIQAQHIALNQGAFISISYKVAFGLIKPHVRGLVGTEAYNWLMPRNFDWSEVSIRKH